MKKLSEKTADELEIIKSIIKENQMNVTNIDKSVSSENESILKSNNIINKTNVIFKELGAKFIEIKKLLDDLKLN